jgi:hypothetical protein
MICDREEALFPVVFFAATPQTAKRTIFSSIYKLGVFAFRATRYTLRASFL